MPAANIAADMYCNVAAESTAGCWRRGSTTRRTMRGMKDMLSFLLARDTMHQQQWLAVIEELGDEAAICRSPTPSRKSGGSGEQLPLLRHRSGQLAGTRRALDARPVARREGGVQRVQEPADGRRPVPRPGTPRLGAQSKQIG
jgi:Mn-containing catalase